MDTLVIAGVIIAAFVIIAIVCLGLHWINCLFKEKKQTNSEEPANNVTENVAYDVAVTEEIREDGSTHTAVKLVEKETENGEEQWET